MSGAAMGTLLAEMAVRRSPGLYCLGYRWSENDKLVYELFPDYTIKSLNAKINSQGLHDRYFPEKKALGVFRIAVIGDSNSFGWKVGTAHGFPKILEGILDIAQDRSFEVINFSVPGYNTAQEYELLKDKVLRFNPDMVILQFTWNDVQLCNMVKPKITVLNFLYNKSFATRFVLRCLDIMLKNKTKLSSHIWSKFKKIF